MSAKETSKTTNKISRQTFLAASAPAAPAAVTALTAPAASGDGNPGAPAVLKGKRRRNVLFISTDDMCNRLGCYGVPVIQSPNLNRLSQSGVRFDHHYRQFPLCGPSRTSLMTGLAPDTTRVWDLHTDFRDTIPQTLTIPQLFQRNGYFVARAGKIYHYNNPSEIGTPAFDDPASWQKTANPAGYDRIHDEGLVTYFASPKRMHSGGSPGGLRTGEEIYDYQKDPREIKNLANNPNSLALKTKLRSQLEQIARSRGMNNTPPHPTTQG